VWRHNGGTVAGPEAPQARPHNAGSVLVLEAVFEHVQVAVFEHVQVELGASCAMP